MSQGKNFGFSGSRKITWNWEEKICDYVKEITFLEAIEKNPYLIIYYYYIIHFKLAVKGLMS